MHPDYTGYFEPLEAMPASVQELFTYNPAKAKKLLAEAGYPNGFTFKVQVCACNADHMDLLPLIARLSRAGRREAGDPADGVPAFLSAMTTRTLRAGYLMNNGHTNPTTTIRKSFVTGQQWNPSEYAIRSSTRRWTPSTGSRDEATQAMLKE